MLSECGGTGLLFIAHKVGFACLSLSEVSLCPRITQLCKTPNYRSMWSLHVTSTSVGKLFRGKGSLHCSFGVEQNKELWNSINAV